MNGGCTDKQQTLTVLSWNINGFTRKKSDVLHHLNLLQADVVFLQETHMGPGANTPGESIRIQSSEPQYDWEVYTIYKRTSRGVAILFRKGLGCEGLRVIGDKNGRYMVISCRFQEQDFVFVNVYNPMDEKIDFTKFRDSLVSVSQSALLVVGGDFNTVMDAKVDKTSNHRNRGHRDRFKGLTSFLEFFSLVDVWRWLYPEEKSFTFFDTKGKSRLDYFFLPVGILKNVTACEIHERIQYTDKEACISDHAPVSVQIQTTGQKWQFQSRFLQDESIMDQLSVMIRNISEAQVHSKGELWPALKVRVTCGTLKAFSKNGDDPRSPEKMAELQTPQVLENHPVEQNDLFSSESCTPVLCPPDILSEASPLQEHLERLHKTNMFEEIKFTLNATLSEPISKKEIMSAICSLPTSDQATPDGLPVLFYKKLVSQITDLLQAFFNQALELQSIKCILNEAFLSDAFPTTVLNFSDNDTDHNYCSKVQQYSPVFIFNVDYHILALILAGRLNSVMGYMMNQGKIRPNLSVYDCVDAFQIIRADQVPVLVFSIKLDPGAVKWMYMFQRFKTLNLPDRFRSIVQFLVLKEDTTTNAMYTTGSTTAVPPTRGLKLGCPLTSLLISICLLPLIHSINEEDRLQGVRIGAEHIKSVLDKDRAIIFLSISSGTLDVFEELLKDFMKDSGFVIDGRFSEVFLTGPPGFSLKKGRLQAFRRMREGFWYKGVFVGSENHGLFQGDS